MILSISKLCTLIVLLSLSVSVQGATNLVRNGGFESSISGVWSIDSKVGSWGAAATPTATWSVGRQVLRLTPNSSNSANARLVAPFGVGQGVAGASLPQRMYVSGLLKADGEAKAILRFTALYSDGTTASTEMRQGASASGVLHRDIFSLTPGRPVFAVIIFCLVEGVSGAAYFDDITLTGEIPSTWKEVRGDADPGTPLTGAISVDASKVVRTIPASLYGSNIEWAGGGQGIWDSYRKQLNPQIVQLTRTSGASLLRFPGGIFSDHYQWKLGVGAQASRPVVDVTPGGPKSNNNFGTDEAIAFARATGSRLMITVNIITGSPAEAADWVRYVNRSALEVEYWEVGNESYVVGNSASLTPDVYANRFLEFARAMRAADSRIKIGAISDENFSLSAPRPYPDWTERLIAIAGQEIDFLAVHCAYAPGIHTDSGWSSRTVYSAFLAAPQAIAMQLDDLSRRLARLAPGRNIKIAVTEWGPYFQTTTSGRFVDHPKTIASAVFAASTLKAILESPATEIANAFKLVDNAYMGWIGVRQDTFIAKAPLHALTMFRQMFGTQLVTSSASSPSFDSPTVGWTDSQAQVPYLETVASLSSDSSKLYLIVINKNFDRAIRASFHLDKFAPRSQGVTYTLSAVGADSNTGTELPFPAYISWAPQVPIAPFNRIDKGTPAEVTIKTGTVAASADFTYEFPPCSVTSIMLTRQ